jgi:hypothetical protein
MEYIWSLSILTSEKQPKFDFIVVGGLHMDDFEWAARNFEEIGYALAAFMIDCDGYHWKAIYIKADQLIEATQKGIGDLMQNLRG